MLFPLFFALQTALTPGPVGLYVGTYTSPDGSRGIYRLSLNTDTGELTEPVLAAESAQPSFLALDSTGRYLYAVDEEGQGQVRSFSVAADKSLKLLNTQSTLGGAPCHLSVSPGDRSLLVANYSGGNVLSLPILADGSLGAASQHFQNSGTGPNPDRQEHPHMHSIQVDPKQRFCFACDLGTDEVLTFPFDKAAGSPVLTNPLVAKVVPGGSGPRHQDMDREGRYLYVDNELSNTVTVFRVDAASGALTEIQSISSVPDGLGAHESAAAEIICHPNGKWVYVSNRGNESLACFSVLPDGLLKLTEIHKLSVRQPRGFAIDPTGKWIVIGGQMSNDLESLKIDATTGGIESEGHKISIHTPVCVLFHPS